MVIGVIGDEDDGSKDNGGDGLAVMIIILVVILVTMLSLVGQWYWFGHW